MPPKARSKSRDAKARDDGGAVLRYGSYGALILLFCAVANYKTEYFAVSRDVVVRKNVFVLDEMEVAETKMEGCSRGGVLQNNKTGETWHITENGENNHFRYSEMYERISGHGFVNVEHIHPYQSEYILVLQGEMKLKKK